MDRQLVIVRGTGNYADEFDMSGFFITTEDIWKKVLERLPKTKWPKECYFGTNEFVLFESAADFVRSCRMQLITEHTARTLIGTLGGACEVDVVDEPLEWDDDTEEIPTLFKYGLFPLPNIGEDADE